MTKPQMEPVLYHGLLLINKPKGITSHDVVSRVRRALKMREVGHAGTLDPLATGLMVLLLGEGTKLSDYILQEDKAYRVKVKLGLRTDSLDITGEVLSQQSVEHLNPDRIVAEARALLGQFTWPVPVFSAIKTGGKKLYQYAHKGEAPQEIPQKEMVFWGLEVIQAGRDFIEVKIRCSKGSYIRSWAAQLGERLGVGGVVEELERLESAPYQLENAVSLEEMEQRLAENSSLSKGLAGLAPSPFISLRDILQGWKTITVSGKDERLIHNGQISHDLERRLIVEQKEATRLQKTLGIRVLSADTGDLLSILEAQPNRRLKIRRVFKMT